jgi:AcrR family transcriptional regulator
MPNMPRVSEAHLAARRQQILDAARACFERNGFHATSIQDVIAEAGLSVGAVYRYFKSKDELRVAIAEAAVGAVVGELTAIAQHEPALPLIEAMDQALDVAESQLQPDGAARLAIQVWAESLRDADMARFVSQTYTAIREQFVTIARRAQAAGELPSDVDPTSVGAALFALMPGYLLQRVLVGSPDHETYLAGIRGLFCVSGRAAVRRRLELAEPTDLHLP